MNAPVANPSFSQFGEDLLVLKFFAGKTSGYFVEVGANDPENLSQTLLPEQRGNALLQLNSTGSKLATVRPGVLPPAARLFIEDINTWLQRHRRSLSRRLLRWRSAKPCQLKS
jgi:hypothetical protein